MARSDVVRAGATAEFTTLCKALYGDLVDPDVIWTDVVKVGPDQADVHAQGSIDRTRMGLRGAAITGGVLGGYLGLKHGSQGMDELKAARAIGSKVSGSTKRKLALSGTLAATDSLDLGVLATEKTRRNPPKGGFVATGNRVGTKAASWSTLTSGLLPKFQETVAGARSAGSKIAGKFKATGVKSPVDTDPIAPVIPPSTPPIAGTARASRTEKVSQAAGTVLRSSTGRAGLAAGAVGGAAAGAGAGKAQRAKTSQNVGKSDVTWTGTFSKLDDDQHLAFGWASVSKVNGLPVVDKQGDYIDPEDLEAAAYEYVLKSRVGGAMHQRDADDRPIKVADIVESMVFTDDKVAKMGLPENFNRGWWVGMKIHDEDEWSLVKKGGRTGFSIHGRGIRKDQNVDELMGSSYR